MERQKVISALHVEIVKAAAGGNSPTLRNVAQHHEPRATGVDTDGCVISWECRGCDPGSYAQDGAEWPCSTMTIIMSGLGMPVEAQP